MSITHHPGDELLLSYASGAASEAVALLVASHAMFCAQCRAAVQRVEFDLDRPSKKFIEALKQWLQMRRLQMNVEIGLAAPVLVEHEGVWIIFRDMEVVVDASGLGAGRRDLGG